MAENIEQEAKASRFPKAGVRAVEWLRDYGFYLALVAFALALLLCGGSSRYDRIVQVPVRVTAVAVLLLASFRAIRVERAAVRVPATLLAATIALTFIQLIPLPPAIWTLLPGRGPFAEVASVAGFPQPWRPIALVPDLAMNALLSLTVPAATFLALAVIEPRFSRIVYFAVLVAIGLSLVVQAVQLITGADAFTVLYDTRPGPAAQCSRA